MLRKSYLLVVLAAVFCLTYVLLPLALAQGEQATPEDSWWDTDWLYRQPINIGDTYRSHWDEVFLTDISFAPGEVLNCSKEVRMAQRGMTFSTAQYDDFNDNSINTSLWTENGASKGTLEEKNGRLSFEHIDTDSDRKEQVRSEKLPDSFELSVEMYPESITNEVGFWIGDLKDSSSNNGWLFVFGTSSSIKIYRRVNGQQATIYNSNSRPWSAYNWYNFKVKKVDSRFEFYFNNTPLLTEKISGPQDFYFVTSRFWNEGTQMKATLQWENYTVKDLTKITWGNETEAPSVVLDSTYSDGYCTKASVAFVSTVPLAYNRSSDMSDEFDSPSLDPKWSWEDPGTKGSYNISQSKINITSQAGADISPGNDKGPRITQGISGDWVAETYVERYGDQNYRHAGIYIYQNSSQQLWWGMFRSDGTYQIRLSGIINNATVNPIQASASPSSVFLKVIKHGEMYEFYYKTGWQDTWAYAGYYNVSLQPQKIGLVNRYWAGSGSLTSYFHYFNIYKPVLSTANRTLYAYYGNPGASEPLYSDMKALPYKTPGFVMTSREQTSAQMYWAKQYSDGTLDYPIYRQATTRNLGLGIADFDKDGDFDYVIGTDCSHSLYINNGIDDFSYASTVSSSACSYSGGGWMQDTAAGDFNGDGWADFVDGGDKHEVHLFINNKNNTFTMASTYYAERWEGNPWSGNGNLNDFTRGKDAADVDGDGDIDFVVASRRMRQRCCWAWDENDSPIYLFTNNDGLGNFTRSYITSVWGTVGRYPYGLAVADFTGDGDVDIAVTGSSNKIYILNGTGDGNFQSPYYTGKTVGDYAALDDLDYNRDGKPDLLVSYSGSLYVYIGDGKGGFESTNILVGGVASPARGNAAPSGYAFVPTLPLDDPEERLTITGPAQLLDDNSIIIAQYEKNWTLPATWAFEWNQTDSVYAGEQYYKQKRIDYNATYNFSDMNSPYFNITGWMLNEDATCAKFTSNFTVANCTANMSEILDLGSNYIYLNQDTINRSNDVLWDNRMPLPVPLPVKEGLRRQDFSQTTTVNAGAYSLLQLNTTNNGSAEGTAANFTDIIIRNCLAGFNCTGFTRMVDTMETVWAGKSQDAVSEALSTLRREGTYSMNLTWDPTWDPTNQDAYFNGQAAGENLTDFSSGKMGFWLYISDISTFTLLEFELGDSPNWGQGNWVRFRNNTVLSDSWQYFQYDMVDNTSSSGTQIDWASAYPKVRVAGTGNSGPQSWILIDDWRMWITPQTYTLLQLNDGQSKTEYRLLSKADAVAGITGANNDWQQDTGQTTTAGGTAYIEGNLKINNTDTITYENVSLPVDQPGQSRSGWTCSHPSREIYSISGVYSSSDYPILCNQNNIITKSEGSWAQVGTATISSQALNKSVIISNTDSMVSYNDIAWSVPQESACGWSVSSLSGTVNLAASASTVEEAMHNGDCVSDSLSSWRQYMTLVSDEIGQYIAQNITLTNNANTGMNIKLSATDFTNPSNYFTPVPMYSDPSNYDNPVPVASVQTVIKRQVSKGDVLSQDDGTETEEQDYYERIVTVTCVDACDKLVSIKLAVEVNDTNYTDFKVYHKEGSWVDRTSDYSLSVSSGQATWYTDTFASTEEYKLWGNGTAGAPPSPAPPEITILSPNNQSYANNWVWANVSLNDSANWCGVSLDSAANQTMNSASATSWYLNISASDGTHDVQFWCNGTNGEMGVSEQRIFTVDSTLPVVTIILPSSGATYGTNSGLPLNYTVSVDPNATWYVLDAGAPVYISSNTTFDVSGDGAHNITVYANDSLSKVGSATVSFTTDTTPPSITIDSPLPQNYSTGVWFNATLDETGDWCGYTLDGTGNYTMASDSTTHFYAQNSTELSIGEHPFTIYCNDSIGNMGSSSSSFNFSETAPTPPTVTIISPQNSSYNYQTNFALDYTTENNPTSCKYYLDGTESSLPGCANTTFNVTADGTHNMTVLVSNAGGSNSSTVLFTVDTVSPTVYLFSPANGTYTSVPISLEYTVDESASCSYSMNAGTNVSISGNTTISPSNGDYNITVTCTDDADNAGTSNSSYFTVDVQTSSPPPSGGGGGGGGGAIPPTTTTNQTPETTGAISLQITADPSSLEIEKNTSATTTLRVSNLGTDLADITLVASGVPADWVSGLKTLTLGINEVKTLEITVTGKEPGNWTLTITASADSDSASVSIPLTVTSPVTVTTAEEVGAAEAPAGPGGLFAFNIPAVSTEMIIVGGLVIAVIAALGVFAAMMRRG